MGVENTVSRADLAYAAIRERILRGDLRAGMPVSRRQLASEFGMSLAPITEALQRLERDELLESRPRAGTRVRVPTEREIRERYEVREAFESQAARLFAARATAVQREEIRRMAAQVDALFMRLPEDRADSELQFLAHGIHAQFHGRIAEGARCRVLFKLIDQNHVLLLNWLYDVSAGRPPLPPEFHRELAAALCTGDEETADRAMRRHVRYGLENVVRNMQRGRAQDWRSPRTERNPEDL